jgi:hypothetical protein
MSVVLACKIIWQTVSLNSVPGTDPVAICSVILWWNTVIEKQPNWINLFVHTHGYVLHSLYKFH